MTRPNVQLINAGPLLRLEAPTVGEDGVLPHDQWSTNLVLEVPNSDSILEKCVIRLSVNTLSYGPPHEVSKVEADDPNFRFKFELNKDDFPSGNPAISVVLNYTVYNPETGNTNVSPFKYTLVFDKQPPGGSPLPYIGFTPEQLLGVYPADITDGNFVATLAPWSGMAIGDTLTPWLNTAPPGQKNSARGLLPETAFTVEQNDVGKPVSIQFPISALEAFGDVTQYFAYQLKDKLGNTSDISPAREIDVHLKASNGRRTTLKTRKSAAPRVIRTRQNPDDLFAPTITGLRPSDGRIKLSDLNQPIVVTVPMPAKPVVGNFAQLYVNGYDPANAIGQPIEPPITGAEFTLEIAIADFPADVFPYVEWQVDYQYYDPFSGDPAFSYKPVQLIFDRSAPGGLPPKPGPIAFTPEQLTGIGPDDIDQTKGGLPVHISAWNDEDLDDQVELWVGTGPLPADGRYLTDKPGPVTSLGVGLEVVFPTAELQSLTTTPVYFGYRVIDWAGNISELSETTPIELHLIDIPLDLLAPLIPDAAPYNPEDGTGTPPSTGLLVWNEANPETTVQIPTYTNVAPGDRIYIQWNSQSVPPVTVTQTDIDNAATNGYLLEVAVPFTHILNGSPGANIAISYRVHPVSGSPEQTSPAQYINVNLQTPGGPDPDPETPEHENLRPLVVRSDYPGSTDNIISAEAYSSPAKLTVFRAGVDNTVTWLVGDKLNIFWGPDHADDPAEIPITAVNETSNIIVPITPALIAANGTGVIDVYYTLTRDLGNNNLVEVRSFNTQVTVQSPDEAPGGIDPLAVADFPDSSAPISGNPHRFIPRSVGLRGTKLRVPLLNAAGGPLANVAAGDFISVDFYGVDDPLDGTGNDIDPTKPVIPQSRITITDYVILASDITRGYYEVPLPYTTTYYICRNLSVTKYSITNAAGITKNAPDTLILFAINLSGGPCTVPTL